MKKRLFLAITMVILALFLVAGCGGGGTETPKEPEAPPAETQEEVVDSEPADSEPAESEAADSEPADSEPADSEPAEEAKPAEQAKPAEESKPAEEPKPEPQQEAEASGDSKELGPVNASKCSGCHGSLEGAVAGVANHPPVSGDSLDGCTPCHSAGAMLLKEVVHKNHDGSSCQQCHD